MTKSVTRSQITRAIQALEAAGTPAKGVVCYPDGSVAVLTETSLSPPPPDENDPDVVLAKFIREREKRTAEEPPEEPRRGGHRRKV